MKYTIVTKSNEAPIDDEGAVEDIIENYRAEDGDYPEALTCSCEIEDGTLDISSRGGMLDVRHAGRELTEQFLDELRPHIVEDEALIVRTVGFKGLKDLPHASQWVVTPDGVRYETL